MTLCDSIELVVMRTGHRRFEWLCGDSNPDPESRAGYRALVLHLAAADPLAALHAPRPDPFPSTPGKPCGCQGRQ